MLTGEYTNIWLNSTPSQRIAGALAAMDLLGGITVIEGTLPGSRRFRAIPYHAWAHRGRGAKNVWLKRAE